MSIDLTRFHASFFNESTDQLETAENCLLLIEKGESVDETTNELFRQIHSIKGSAGTLGFNLIADFSHEFESLLDLVRSGSIRIDDELVGLCFSAVDLLSAMLVHAKEDKGDVELSRVQAVTRRLQLAQNRQLPVSAGPLSSPPPPQVVQSSLSAYSMRFVPGPDMVSSGNDPLLYLREIRALGHVILNLDTSKLPGLRELDLSQSHLAWDAEIQTTLSKSEIEQTFAWIDDICEIQLEAVTEVSRFKRGRIEDSSVDQPDLSSNEAGFGSEAHLELIKAGSDTFDRRKSTVHVRADRLDALINQIGEIAISHGIFKQSLKSGFASEQVEGGLNRLDRQLRQLQDTVLSLRMLPVRVLFGRFERIVRDARIQLNKDIKLVIEGSQTELDKNLIEKLSDPIMHLVKNAIDHGVETNEERLRANKPAQASLVLRARNEGGAVVVTVSDDGRGVDAQRVRRKAIELGLAQESDDYSNQQWLQFIYRAGFSTSNQVSHWSGRGVGLDAVQNAISALGGELTLRSQPGLGCDFVIRLPLTLAIIDALLVRSAGSIYALPMNFIRECLRPSSLVLADVSTKLQMPKVDGTLIPGLHLSKFLGNPNNADCFQLDADAQNLLVEVGENRSVIQVDEIVGQEQIVVRSLEKHFHNPGYANGATILGDGSVALILDPLSLVRVKPNITRLKELSYV